MGFRQPDLSDAYSAIRRSIGEIHSPYNDGYVGSYCKKELYLLKSWLDEAYATLPKFSGEEEWEQERLIEKLKQKER